MGKTAQKGWRSFAEQASVAPLPLLAGWQAPVAVGLCCQLHDHASVEMVYHRRGSGITRLGPSRREEVAFSEGSCVIYAPGLLHDQVMDTAGEDICVHLEMPSGFSGRLSGCLVVRDASRWVSEDWDRLTSGKKITDKLEQRILDMRGTSVLLAMLRQCFSPSRDKPASAEKSVLKAEEYIREHFAGISSMQEVAEHAGLSHDRLRHLFRQQRGISLVGFLTRIRIERSKSLLLHSKLPLKQIAELCGYRDEYYFSAVFKRQTGQPPGAFRK